MIGGIDPGLGGALALLDIMGRLVLVRDMPALQTGKTGKRSVNEALLADILRSWETEFGMEKLVVEAVTAGPRDGRTSAFNFGCGYGKILGVAAGLRIPVHSVRPAVWKPKMGLNKAKDTSRARALQVWPEKSEYFARSKDDGRAEAALLTLGHMQERY